MIIPGPASMSCTYAPIVSMPRTTEFGTIVGFVHPEGLYSESYEKGYNGKDHLECVEISGRAGLPRKLDPDGNPKIFITEPDKCKHCEILPMDRNGGVRIKNYWEIKKS